MTTTPPVTFDFATWTGLFPIFANCTPVQGQNWFNRATFLCGDQSCNPTFCVPDMLSTALYLLTSHIAWLDAPRDASGNPAASGSAPPPIVGRISNASEGSVSVATDVGGDGNASFPGDWWYKQTRWGAEYVAMTAAVRTAHYVPSPRLPFVPNGYFTGRRGLF